MSAHISDSGVFGDSVLYHALNQNKAGLPPDEALAGGNVDVPYFIVGDDAFALNVYIDWYTTVWYGSVTVYVYVLHTNVSTYTNRYAHFRG